MNTHQLAALATFALATTAASSGPSKTITSEKIRPGRIEEAPYRHNGLILSGPYRGSGFCAWNSRTFFSAAHVVYEEGWTSPPIWIPKQHGEDVNEEAMIQTRGYFRWSTYADLVAEDGMTGDAFGRDVILGYTFKKLGAGSPAKIDRQGGRHLTDGVKTMITGYPARDFYLNKPIKGYYLHRTAPAVTPFRSYSDRAIYTPSITTGPGNSGGPIWSKDPERGWIASGVLVGGRPSETIVYAFSNEINSLIRAVEPVISKPQGTSIGIEDVGATSMFFPYARASEIPDGSHRWTNFKLGVGAFERDSSLKTLKLSLDIRTPHRGDLVVILGAPGGYEVLVHNEEGAGRNDLIFRNWDLSESFAGIDPNGTWILRVQDRLKGDVATFKSFRLEIAVEDPEPAEP